MEYYAPASLKEAEKLKNRKGRNFYLAGGTALNWKGTPRADALIDIKNLGLEGIKISKTGIMLGAAATIQEIASERRLPRAIVKAAKSFESSNVRNMATAGGSASGKFFVSNILPVLAAYKADIEYFKNGRKHKASLDVWLKTKPGLICSIIIISPTRRVETDCEKIAAMDFPAVVAAAGFYLSGGKIKDPVFAFSGAGKNLEISAAAAAYARGKKPSELSCQRLSEAVRRDVRASGDFKISARVKARIVESLTVKIAERLQKAK